MNAKEGSMRIFKTDVLVAAFAIALGGWVLVSQVSGCMSDQDTIDRINDTTARLDEVGQGLGGVMDQLERLEQDPDADQEAVSKAKKFAGTLEAVMRDTGAGLELAISVINEDGSVNQDAFDQLVALGTAAAPASAAPYVGLGILGITAISSLVQTWRKSRQAREEASRADAMTNRSEQLLKQLQETVTAIERAKAKSTKLSEGFDEVSTEINARMSPETQMTVSALRSQVVPPSSPTPAA